jgi:protein phosphatase
MTSPPVMVSGYQAARAVLSAYNDLFDVERSPSDQIGVSIPLPVFTEDTILPICEAAKNHFERLPVVLDLRAPFYVVGDIHGHIFDLVRIFTLTTIPPRSRLLFLGDYVDRGEYSVEVITLLFSFMILHPDNVVLLRGNHEFRSMNSSYGFANEVASVYPSRKIHDFMNQAFMYMPLVAIVDKVVFCVHGGIAPTVTSLDRLMRLRSPILTYDISPVSELVWSDPVGELDTFDASSRGLGVHFGVKALEQFLENLGMRMVIRAHRCVQTGISRFADDKLYTVFSCSGYEGSNNRCGLLFLDEQVHVEFFSLPVLDQIPRASALLRMVPHADVMRDLQGTDARIVKLWELQRLRAKFVIAKAARNSRAGETLLNLVAAPGLSRSVLVPVMEAPAVSLPPLPGTRVPTRRRLSEPLELTGEVIGH